MGGFVLPLNGSWVASSLCWADCWATVTWVLCCHGPVQSSHMLASPLKGDSTPLCSQTSPKIPSSPLPSTWCSSGALESAKSGSPLSFSTQWTYTAGCLNQSFCRKDSLQEATRSSQKTWDWWAISRAPFKTISWISSISNPASQRVKVMPDFLESRPIPGTSRPFGFPTKLLVSVKPFHQNQGCSSIKN